jgi:cardiolipin synthase A/B
MSRSPRHRRKNPGYLSQNKIKLVSGGRTYFDQILEMINRSEEIIQLQVYIFDEDETGREVVHALKNAVKRNVRVYLMADGYASQNLSKKFITELEDSGIHFRFFEPLFRSRHTYFGRRLHHKILVADNRVALVGGINISNHYNDMPGQPGWLDFALYMEGEIAHELCIICNKIWAGYLPLKRILPCREVRTGIHIRPGEDCQLRVRRNDWVMKRNQVSRSYIEMFRHAQDHIIMMSGYFLPGRVIRKNMRKAAARGVKIKLVLAGISDVMVAKYAERYMYNWLFRNGIEVYEYKPRVLHGKVAVYDGQWATIGSYNVNIISAYASIELNIDVNNRDFACMLDQKLEKIIQEDCVLITKEDFNLHNNILYRLWEQICYWFISLLFFLFTFNFKQRD